MPKRNNRLNGTLLRLLSRLARRLPACRRRICRKSSRLPASIFWKNFLWSGGFLVQTQPPTDI